MSTQAERWARREPLLHLLTRAARGALTPAEGPLLRAAVETELTDTEAIAAERDALAAAVGQLQHLCTVPSPDPGGATPRAVAYSAGWVEALDRVQTVLDRLYVAEETPSA